jgi:hypothetical protein
MAALERAGLERLTLDWPLRRVRNCGPYNMFDAIRGAVVVANTQVFASYCGGFSPDRSSIFTSNAVVEVEDDLVDFAAILDNLRMCPKLALAHSRSCRDSRAHNDPGLHSTAPPPAERMALLLESGYEGYGPPE